MPSRAKRSATASARSGTSVHSTVGSAAVCTNITVCPIAPLFSSVSLKNRKSSYFRPMPPSTMTSTSACMAMRASSSLYGSPETENMGSFWLSTSVLNMSIMGMPVRIMLRGTTLRVGLTDGPPMGIMFSVSAGPLSLGTPEPVKTRPSRCSE